MKIQKITPFFWFDMNAEEAVSFYTSVFKNSKVLTTARHGEATAKATGSPKGSVLTISFMLDGQQFVALNGGPAFKFNHAISFVVNCETQEEIDYYWEKLSAGGVKEQCGWLTDKFGVAWQIVPAALEEWISSDAKSDPVMQAVLQMQKLDMNKLKNAFA